jgi:hypothetical protein
MREHPLNKENPFIRGYYIDPNICDRIFEESNNNRSDFKSGIKEYDDYLLTCFDQSVYNPYIESLFSIIENYKKEFPVCYQSVMKWALCSQIKIQRYQPGKYYSDWHCENVGSTDTINGQRHLVYMTYLNDLSDGGGTEFYSQKLTVKPEKGLTLIWPADWTHHHRGVVSNTEEKIIISGWWNFVPQK